LRIPVAAILKPKGLLPGMKYAQSAPILVVNIALQGFI
jgi:hypothetical protein